MSIDTAKASSLYRSRTLDTVNRRVLMTRLQGSAQETDLSSPVNCGGVGRIRHFRRATAADWPSNSLPIDPAAHALNLGEALPSIEAQVFQNAACNWRCWYCYVPFNLLSADERHSTWSSIDDLVVQYAGVHNRPPVIDLSGGQPELTPELVLWTMRAIQEHGLETSTFLWSDDNLSTDYFWSKLSQTERNEITSYGNYARVGCFKGFDRESFAFNTMARPELYEQQFDLMQRSIAEGLDMYAYATLTSPNQSDIPMRMEVFVDDLQKINRNLPLRTVPLEVQIFTPMEGRIRAEHLAALQIQKEAVHEWQAQLKRRFSDEEINAPIDSVSLNP